MGGDHHGHKPYVVPDHKIYKLDNCPELLAAEKFLASKGLKDPWLRNEVWRHDPQFAGPRRSAIGKWSDIIFRGFRYGVAATVIVVALESVWSKPGPEQHGHDHH